MIVSNCSQGASKIDTSKNDAVINNYDRDKSVSYDLFMITSCRNHWSSIYLVVILFSQHFREQREGSYRG